MTTRRVEMAFVWSDGSWDTNYVDIPADTPDDKFEAAGRKAAIAWVEIEPRKSVDLVGTFLYNTSDGDLTD